MVEKEQRRQGLRPLRNSKTPYRCFLSKFYSEAEYDFSEEKLQDSLNDAFRLRQRYPVWGLPGHL